MTEKERNLRDDLRNLRDDLSERYDIYSLWRDYLNECLEQPQKINRNNITETEARLVMLFFPISIFDISKSKYDESELLTFRNNALNGILDDEAKFVGEIKNAVFQNNAHAADFIKHHDYKNLSYSNHGDRYREKYCQLIKDETEYKKQLNGIIKSLHTIPFKKNSIKDIIEEYFISGDYFSTLGQYKKPYADKLGSYYCVVKNMLETEEDKYPILAKLIICLGLGERVLECIDFILSIDKDIKSPIDFCRKQIVVAFDQSDFKSAYELLKKMDSNLFDDLDKVDVSNKRSIDFYYTARLYAEGIIVNEKILLGKDETNAKKAFLICLKQFTRNEDNIDTEYIGEALYRSLMFDKAFFDDAEIGNKYGKSEVAILQKAVNYGSVDAALYLGKKYEEGDHENDIEADVEKALAIYMEIEKPAAYRSAVRIIKNKIKQKQDEFKKYNEFLRKAADLYIEDAVTIISNYKRAGNVEEKQTIEENGCNYYFILGQCEENEYFIQSLSYDEQKNVIIFDGSEKDNKIHRYGLDKLESILEHTVPYFNDRIENAIEATRVRVYFVALGADKKANLKYAVDVIDLCLKRHIYLKSLFENQKKESGYGEIVLKYLQNNVRIAANVNKYESAIYLDRLQSRVKGVYVPIRYVSYFEEASYDLLWSKAPLFTARFRGNTVGHHNRFVVLADSPDIIPIVNNMLSVMYFGDCDQVYDLKIIGPVSDKIESYLKIYESGLFQVNRMYDRVSQVECLQVSFEDELLWEEEEQEADVCEDERLGCGAAKKALKSADYVVCCLSDSERNIQIAELIREREIRSLTKSYNPNYNDVMQIACLCRNNNLVRDTRGFFVDEHYVHFPWYSSYNLIGFGDAAKIYSFNNIFGSFIDMLALKTHEAYFKDKDGSIDVTAAKSDYYSSQYSMDSSKVNALYTIYLMYTVGLFDDLREWSEDNFKNRISNYMEHFEEILPSQKVELAKRQHSQWVMYMKTRGYVCATIEQVRNYMSNGNGKHHSIKVAKLHPYMLPWEMLGDTAEEHRKKYIDKLDEKVRVINEEVKTYGVCTDEEIASYLNNLLTKESETRSISVKLNPILDAAEIVRSEENDYSEFLEKLAGHVKKYLCDVYSGFDFQGNNANKHLSIDNAKRDLENIIMGYSWLQENNYYKRGRNKEDIINGIMEMYRDYYGKDGNNLPVWENFILKDFWNNIKNIKELLYAENVTYDAEKAIDIVKQRNYTDITVKDLQKKIKKRLLDIEYAGRKLKLARDFYDCFPEEVESVFSGLNLSNRQEDELREMYSDIKKMESVAKEILRNLISIFRYKIEESIDKYVEIYNKLNNLLSDFMSYSNVESTGLQYELDELMKELNLDSLGSIKENDIRMIEGIPESYRILLREYKSNKFIESPNMAK